MKIIQENLGRIDVSFQPMMESNYTSNACLSDGGATTHNEEVCMLIASCPHELERGLSNLCA
jgi:hypothetical protein